jgi:fucose 4-O-acetylase-like acetyltransferase
MWKNSQRYLQHCLYFDFLVCVLLWLKKIGAKTFRFTLVQIRCMSLTCGSETWPWFEMLLYFDKARVLVLGLSRSWRFSSINIWKIFVFTGAYSFRKHSWRCARQSTRKYRVFRAQADWTFILPSELPAKELRHLPSKMPPRGATYWEVC